MTRRSLYTKPNLNIYQSFTDLMSNAFMILSLFFLIALFASLDLNRRLKIANERLQTATPIIIDEKSDKFKFQSGSAELTEELRDYISKEVGPNIKDIVEKRDIDFIQVIGHTDGQGIYNRSNLDQTLEKVANGDEAVKNLQAGSNADLGLMRALSVVQELKKTGMLNNVEFRAYSAAQLYLPSGELAPVNRDADASRRRIEIRFIPPGESGGVGE